MVNSGEKQPLSMARERIKKREWIARGGLEAPQGGNPSHATTSGGCPSFFFLIKLFKKMLFKNCFAKMLIRQ
jgi:hypothetical protein